MQIDVKAQAAVLVLPLNDTEATIERAGGKGAPLAQLALARLAVPPGFHITAAVAQRPADNGLRGPRDESPVVMRTPSRIAKTCVTYIR